MSVGGMQDEYYDDLYDGEDYEEIVNAAIDLLELEELFERELVSEAQLSFIYDLES